MGTNNNFITVSDLTAVLDGAAAITVVDVRKRPAFDQSDGMIAGAVWRDPMDIDRWLDEVRGLGRIVVYCVHGHEVSQGAAAALRADGIDAVYLEGGYESFAAAGGPVMAKPDA